MSNTKKINNFKKKQRGDTLIEIAFALVIIGFIVAVAIQGAIKAHQAAVTARKRTQATFIARSQLEMIQVVKGYFMDKNGWGTSGSDPLTVLGQLSNMGMGVPAAVPCSGVIQPGAPSSEFHAFPSPNWTNPNPQTAFLAQSALGPTQYADVDKTASIAWNDANSATVNSSLLDYDYSGSLHLYSQTLMDKSIGELYNASYAGFSVSSIARLTDSRPTTATCGANAGFGLNDVTVTTTVSWQDGAGNNQEVVQTNRISNNI